MVWTIGRRTLVGVGVLVAVLALPAWGYAQDAAAIAGAVTDASGAVLPGVTVEATSPALIERVRATVTDGQGLYRLVDLRPGAYTVTFTLPGFSVVKREGLALTSGFTATVNAELRVGAVEETILVTGESPVVDLQNVRQQTTLQRETLEALPTTGRIAHLGVVVPGATLANAFDQNVGGLSERGSYGIHGSQPNDTASIVAGMNQRTGTGGSSTFVFNNLAFQEVTVETSGMSAERVTGGVQMIMVPKDGGNIFSGSATTAHTFPGWQSENITDALQAQGLVSGKSAKKYYDSGFGLGGPMLQDRLWFFGAYRRGESQQFQQGNYYDLNPNPLIYEADVQRPAFTDDRFDDYSLRLTWQAARQHKIVGSLEIQPSRQLFLQATPIPTPEAAAYNAIDPNALPLVSWTYTPSNRVLVEAGASGNVLNVRIGRFPGAGTDAIAVIDVGRGLLFGSRTSGTGALTPGNSYAVRFTRQYHQQAAVSYVTGSHNLKVGFAHDVYAEGQSGRYTDPNQINQARSYTFRNGVPLSVAIWAVPFGARSQTRLLAGYAQDQWTMRRLTLNLGVRLTNTNGSAPATELPAGPFVPARSFAAARDIPNYWNLNPRFGAAYDLFGNAKTAVKVSLGRFNPFTDGLSVVAAGVPANNQATNASRTWTDANGNLVPECDLRSSAANGECGPWSDLTFGQIRAGSTRIAQDAVEGFNRQFYNWQVSASVQHELAPNVALNVGYFRTWYGGFLATDNQAVTPADYSHYCLTAPANSRLPGGGGTQLCGLYDIVPTKFGQIDNLVTLASHYGDQTEIYNGIDAALTARFGGGRLVSGGLSVGRTATNNCFVVDSPQQAREGFCDVTPPWSSGSQVKLMVVYPLPWDLQTSAIYQNIPGIPTPASYVASNAEIAPSLGRNLAACGTRVPCTATANVDLVPTNTVVGIPTSQAFVNATSARYLDRLQQVDLRVSRTFRVGARARVQGNFDLYNLFNASNTLRLNPQFGATWLNTFQTLGGRLAKAGVTFNF